MGKWNWQSVSVVIRMTIRAQNLLLLLVRELRAADTFERLGCTQCTLVGHLVSLGIEQTEIGQSSPVRKHIKVST